MRGSDRPHHHSASATVLVHHHLTSVQALGTVARQLATDADLLIEALRYFSVSPRRGGG